MMKLSLSSFPSHNEYPQDTTYVALAATLLPPELQVHASAAGLCFLRVVDHADQAKGVFVRVTALPHRLDDMDSSRVFTLYLSREQLAQALPWDRQMQARATCDVRELVTFQSQGVFTIRVDAGQLASKLPFPSQNEPHPTNRTTRPHPQERREQADHLADQPQETITLLPLPELFVSSQTVQEIATATPNAPSRTGSVPGRLSWTRFAWLHAALAMVRRQMSHAQQAFAKLDTLLENVIATQRHLRQSLVSASAVYVGERLVGWRLQIAYPVREVLA
jgi:hypothetical protein